MAERVSVDALAVPVALGEPLVGPAAEIDRQLGGLLSDSVSSEFRGRIDEVLPLPSADVLGARRVLLYGVGRTEDLDGQRLRHAHHQMVRRARAYGYRRLAVLCSPPLGPEHLAAVVEGSVLGSWALRSRQAAAP